MKNFGMGKKRAAELRPRLEACATHHLETRYESDQFHGKPILVLDSDAPERAAVARSYSKLHPQAQVHLFHKASHLHIVLRGRSVAERVEAFCSAIVPPPA